MTWKRFTFSQNCSLNFRFWSFPRTVVSGPSCLDIAHIPSGVAPLQPQSTKVETNTPSELGWPHFAILCFVMSPPIVSTECLSPSPASAEGRGRKGNYSWDEPQETTQLQASVSVLSTLKAGWAKLWCLVDQMYSVHIQLIILSRTVGVLRQNPSVSRSICRNV